eukprot:TRINITY_DN71847_c0_g1_i1.p1 TRINITY_DN71847_c0_g1~~TRINITY_DN71847_c0_g1_i1.p1  ORF type:complete len:333 (+),score=45.15 TRINITY_DN71847_c0_g1_i1:75-1001(+)
MAAIVAGSALRLLLLVLAFFWLPHVAGQDENQIAMIHPKIGRVKTVSYGASHIMYLLPNMELYGEGQNTFGQIGDGTTKTRTSPVLVFVNVSMMTAGSDHTVFLTTDGRAWAVGRNDVGQLGDGTRIHRRFPKQVMQNAISSSGGLKHSLFLKRDGSIWATGLNDDGQLCDGTRSQRISPVQVHGVPAGVLRVVAGGYHSLFVRNDSSIWACGQNTHGQLGDGSRLSTRRVINTGISNVTIEDVFAGDFYSTYKRPDGSLWSVGLYEEGNYHSKVAPTETLSSAARVQSERTFVPNAYFPLYDRSKVN